MRSIYRISNETRDNAYQHLLKFFLKLHKSLNRVVVFPMIRPLTRQKYFIIIYISMYSNKMTVVQVRALLNTLYGYLELPQLA